MKPIFFAFFMLISSALAQETQRIVVLPFSAAESTEAYGLGLAVGLQRSLNLIDGVYVPPPGDSLLVTNRLQRQGNLSPETVSAAYNATAIVSGQFNLAGDQVNIVLGFAGVNFPVIKDVLLQASASDTRDLMQRVTDTVIQELQLSVSVSDRQQLNSVIAQTPSLPSLQAVAQASLRLDAPNMSELEAAAALDPTSSWVLAERARALALRGDELGALNTSLLAIQYGPNDIEALILRGIILLSSGDRATAELAFDAALPLNPSHAVALEGKGVLRQDVTMLEASIRSNPRLVNAYIDLANIQQASDEARALQTLQRGTLAAPDSLVLQRSFILLAIRLGDPAGALAHLQRLLADESLKSPQLYSFASLLPSPEYTPQALALIQEGRASYPNSVDLVLAEVAIYENQDDLVSAENILLPLWQQNPNSAQIANQLAIVQARQGKLDIARATLETSAGQNDIARLNLAQIYLQANQAQAAVEILESLVQRLPNDDQAFTLYGVALAAVGRNDQAINVLDQALALNPNQAEAQEAKALIEQNQGLLASQRIEISPEATESFEQGLAALRVNDVEFAVAAFNRARALDDNAITAFYQAFALQRAGFLRSAIPHYERALQDLPDSETVLNNLGYVHLQLGGLDKAYGYLSQAAVLNPNNIEVRLNLGLLYYNQERYSDAVREFETALSLNPNVAEDTRLLLEDARQKAIP